MEHFAPTHSAPCPNSRAWPRLSRRPGTSANSCPTHQEARGATCDSADRPIPDTSFRIRKQFSPLLSQLAPALANPLLKIFANPFRHQKFGVLRPSIKFLGQPHFFFAQRFAMSFLGVLLVRRAVSYVAIDDNQRRTDLQYPERRRRPCRASSRSFASGTCVTFQP